LQQERGGSGRIDMSGWMIFWILLLVVIAILVLVNMHDIKRYLKIRRM
jgi:hypothetical protein